jgi:GT2 family glycosyltransferase
MKASVIILNWNGKHLLDECLESVLSQQYQDYEIIIVDNGSTDNSVNYLNEKYSSKAKIIALNKNKGFAGGCNEGIKVARGDYICLLNNDAIVDKNWLGELISAAELAPDIGMCASKILNYYNREEFDTLGHLIYPDGLNRGRGKFEKDINQYDKMEEAFFPSGAAALYRKDMLNEIGLFDEDFFAYGDDTDIGLRARLAGWKCVYVPSAIAYHKSSASSHPYSPWKIYLVERNRILILFKYFPLRFIILSPFYTAVRFWYNFIGILHKKGASSKFIKEFSFLSLISAIIKAYIVAALLLPKIIIKRIIIYRKIK